ncbi:MAG: transporter permease [Actinomycetia bacterium]|nr:transporter permease [Actinomycetes bacterium]MDQ1658491.1 type transport system permease protein [Cryptosporangiaceae bacterium]
MIAVELVKLVRRPRTWVSIVLLCALPAMVAIFLAVTKIGPAPGKEPAFLSAVLANGSLLPAAALALVLPLFLPVAVAVMAGDSIAGEASSGMLRYLLMRPVGRTRLLLAKLVALLVFMVAAVVAVAVSSYILGRALFPAQPGAAAAVSVSGSPLTTTQLVLRICAAVGYVAVSMLAVGAIGLFLSTLTDSSLGAALGALAALVASEVLVTLDAAGAVRTYLPTRYWFAWLDFFRDPILWRDIDRGLAIQAVYTAVFLALAWANFATKDITS